MPISEKRRQRNHERSIQHKEKLLELAKADPCPGNDQSLNPDSVVSAANQTPNPPIAQGATQASTEEGDKTGDPSCPSITIRGAAKPSPFDIVHEKKKIRQQILATRSYIEILSKGPIDHSVELILNQASGHLNTLVHYLGCLAEREYETKEQPSELGPSGDQLIATEPQPEEYRTFGNAYSFALLLDWEGSGKPVPPATQALFREAEETYAHAIHQHPSGSPVRDFRTWAPPPSRN